MSLPSPVKTIVLDPSSTERGSGLCETRGGVAGNMGFGHTVAVAVADLFLEKSWGGTGADRNALDRMGDPGCDRDPEEEEEGAEEKEEKE